MADIIPTLGEKDGICQAAGKEMADVGQEALDSENRVMDSLMEGLQASSAMKTMMERAKAEAWDPRKMWTQFALGILRDVGYEDMSLDRTYEPGSQT
jgi:hypothetical protein